MKPLDSIVAGSADSRRDPKTWRRASHECESPIFLSFHSEGFHGMPQSLECEEIQDTKQQMETPQNCVYSLPKSLPNLNHTCKEHT